MSIISFDINQSIEDYISQIEKEEWYNLTDNQINLMTDIKKQFRYMKKRRDCFALLISPLYEAIKDKKNFNFSNPENLLTCKNILEDLFCYYNKKNLSVKQIIEIAKEDNPRKKY